MVVGTEGSDGVAIFGPPEIAPVCVSVSVCLSAQQQILHNFRAGL